MKFWERFKDGHNVLLIGSFAGIFVGMVLAFFVLRTGDQREAGRDCSGLERFLLQCKKSATVKPIQAKGPNGRAATRTNDMLESVLLELRQARIRIESQAMFVRETCVRNKDIIDGGNGSSDPIARVEILQAIKEICKGTDLGGGGGRNE